jgi:uncharacterized protein (TIGR03437 family)
VNGLISAALTLHVTDTAPAIFTTTMTGSGQGAILNQDTTVNTSKNPATKGTVVSIFATGEGQLSPGGVTGSVTPLTPPFPTPVATPVSVTIGGAPATILYAGEAPGLVSGVLQVNAVVPQGIGSGPQLLVLTVGNNSSVLARVTVEVQ